MSNSKAWGFVGMAATCLLLSLACGDEATTPAQNPPVRCGTGGSSSCGDAAGSGGKAGSGGALKRDAGSGSSAGSGGKHIDGGPPDARTDATPDACAGGHCTQSCPAGQAPCGNACIDTKRDPKNCGSCGHDCGAEICNNGSCSACVTAGEIQQAPASTSVTLAGATDRGVTARRSRLPIVSTRSPRRNGDVHTGTPGGLRPSESSTAAAAPCSPVGGFVALHRDRLHAKGIP
jgi:hypothetical protein